MTDDPKNKPGELFLQGGEPFHENAAAEFNNRVRQFKDRLEENAISQYKQDRSDNVSARHVTRAYDYLVSPGKRRRLLEVASTALFGACISGLISFFVSVPVDAEPLSVGQFWLLLGLIAGAVLTAIGMTWTVRF